MTIVFVSLQDVYSSIAFTMIAGDGDPGYLCICIFYSISRRVSWFPYR